MKTAGGARYGMVLLFVFMSVSGAAAYDGPALDWILPPDTGRLVHSVGPGPEGRYAVVFNQTMKLAALIGTPVHCPLAGTVVAAGMDMYMGRVVIHHGEDLYSVYGNLQEVHVTTGSSVTAGHILGRIGVDEESDTGALEFQLWSGSTLIDPSAAFREMPAGIRMDAARRFEMFRERVH